VNISQAIREWQNKKRRMGCVSAAQWFCKRVKGFAPKRLVRFNKKGEQFQHVVATDGLIIIDLTPHLDQAKS